MFDRVLMAFGVTLYRIGLARSVIAVGKRNPKVLLFHDVGDTESRFMAGLGTTMPVRIFANHLDFLARYYKVVSLDELIAESSEQPRVAIAFDDGYRSVMTNAMPLLKKANMPAIVYLITRAVGNRSLVWVNELNWLLADSEACMVYGQAAFGLSSSSTAADVISAARVCYNRSKIEAVMADLRLMADTQPEEEMARDPLYLDWADVTAMTTHGFIFGNHTASHPNMGRLTDNEQRSEIVEAQDALRKNGIATVHFAHPFGHHNDRTIAIAREVGLQLIAEVGGNNAGNPENGIGRVDIRANTSAELFAQIEIVEPVKAWLRRRLRKPKAGWEPLLQA